MTGGHYCYICKKETDSPRWMLTQVYKTTFESRPFCPACYPGECARRDKAWARAEAEIDRAESKAMQNRRMWKDKGRR